MPAEPLPQCFVTTAPGVGGRIKVRAEDFLVDEIPAYDPSGVGEHLYLGIEKTNVPHSELMNVLSRFFGIGRRGIGFAGMKDKVGVARQAVSIHLPGDVRDPDALVGQSLHRGVLVLWAHRHGNKIRRGHLLGNRFSIRIRDVDPLRVIAVRGMLEILGKTGVPNYFGPQRFGYRLNNHHTGWLLVTGQDQALLDELLGTGGTAFPEHQRRRREMYEQGKFAESRGEWSSADYAEREALWALNEGMESSAVVKRIGKSAREFWQSAMQSAIFNRVLDERLANGTFDRLVEGDLAWRHDNRSVFAVTREELTEELAGRAARLEVSPSGPLWGTEMLEASGAVGGIERDAISVLGWDVDAMRCAGRASVGARRPLRIPLKNVQVDGGADEHGGYIRVAFDLPRGAYATVVLRELMKVEADALTGRAAEDAGVAQTSIE